MAARAVVVWPQSPRFGVRRAFIKCREIALFGPLSAALDAAVSGPRAPVRVEGNSGRSGPAISRSGLSPWRLEHNSHPALFPSQIADNTARILELRGVNAIRLPHGGLLLRDRRGILHANDAGAQNTPATFGGRYRICGGKPGRQCGVFPGWVCPDHCRHRLQRRRDQERLVGLITDFRQQAASRDAIVC
jgi:hypothetical protein